AHGDRGARARHRPRQAADGAGEARAPGRASLPLGHERPGDGRRGERPIGDRARSERAHPGGEGVLVRHPSRPAAARPGARRVRRCAPREGARGGGRRAYAGTGGGAQDVSALETYGPEARERVGFFTDTSVCIGCKACEVACKEWNVIPQHAVEWSGNSYDNTEQLGPEAWRHVAFVEQRAPVRLDGESAELDGDPLRWLMSSDVCKHCTHAACLDVCPTGSLFRTELGTVVVQEDISNGCGYCVPACPFGVLS